MIVLILIIGAMIGVVATLALEARRESREHPDDESSNERPSRTEPW